MFPVHTVWQPVLDPGLAELAVLPADPLTRLRQGHFNNVDLIVGSNSGDGVSQVGSAGLLTDPQQYAKLEREWEVEGPRLLLGRHPATPRDLQLANRLRRFYLGQQRLDSGSREVDRGLAELMTDNMYQAGGRQMLEVLLERNSQAGNTFYQYLFSYIGSVTNTQTWFNVSRPDLGACHADELLYLFSGPQLGGLALQTQQDKLVSQFLTRAWTQFAKATTVNMGMKRIRD